MATARQADISNHADKTTARDKNAKTLLPDFGQLIVECLIVGDKA